MKVVGHAVGVFGMPGYADWKARARRRYAPSRSQPLIRTTYLMLVDSAISHYADRHDMN
ncbi:hypothetical protein GGQ11_002282 [Salinibacter ruber]|uniref:Uncharacterized protein n=1 Tax=Salinibacter ruber TaxID=146919 RepID=A0A9X2U8L6_9BACT|nr:hypothetical protein [Salinibacter ruber]MCS3951805.1 hypothetical protein [Salinibacter ruber]MCS4118183.1 hypothetical protein [Salinibacter ruber]MCS4154453.1 hypothetical protein [Salinibacter ruber]MCS4171031.1 hypothetical protein [Salinibacter ruber]